MLITQGTQQVLLLIQNMLLIGNLGYGVGALATSGAWNA